MNEWAAGATTELHPSQSSWPVLYEGMTVHVTDMLKRVKVRRPQESGTVRQAFPTIE